jgi:aspartyl-tRNA(Asn)/glutamyl-tRNA(Gln) amidotransferase subunit B
MAYYPIIGLEIHIQLNTKTKLFCRCKNEYTPDEPNKNICPFCTGQPGALPVLNKIAVEKALLFGVAVGAVIPEHTRWDRKNYFYPDLPAGYQISQYDNPVTEKGFLEFFIENKKTGEFSKSKVDLTRAHLESDAGKSLHLEGKTLVDFNRSGTPLIEVVTEPQIRNSSEAMAFVAELQLLVKTLGISEANMDKGQIRFDCNLSLQTQDQFDNNKLPDYKVEIKNINSIRSLGRAIEYEIIRQAKLLDDNLKPSQETRGWKDDLNKSVSQREKEQAHDYRYFPEPDLRILEIQRSDIPTDLPELPSQKRAKYMDLGLNLQQANTFVTQPEVGKYFEQSIENQNLDLLKPIANIISVNLLGLATKTQKSIWELISTDQLVELVKLFKENKISNQGLQTALEKATASPDKTILEIVEQENLLQISDDSLLEKIADLVIANNPNQVSQYKAGKIQIIGFLVGNCMKESKGQGNPAKFKEILERKLQTE